MPAVGARQLADGSTLPAVPPAATLFRPIAGLRLMPAPGGPRRPSSSGTACPRLGIMRVSEPAELGSTHTDRDVLQ